MIGAKSRNRSYGSLSRMAACPVSVAVDTLTNKIYTANQAGGSVTEIDGASNVTTNIPAGAFPLAVAVDQTSNKIYVTSIKSTYGK